MPPNFRYQQAKKVTLIGAIINVILGISKLIGGILFNSNALVADGLHSFSDLFTDITVLFASKYGSQDADDDHPYGHQRIETAATLGVALLLILAGVGIGWDALSEIINKQEDTPHLWSLPIAIFSIVANELLFHYTLFVGKRIDSELIIANAWHHRSDAAASLVVLIGLLGSIAGYHLLDPLAAIIISGMIIRMGITYGWDSVKELIDTGLDPHLLTQIQEIIASTDGVQKIHQLRSRKMGKDILIDVHIQVAPYISVSEGHYIAQHVHRNLMSQIAQVKDITVHVDPEDDEIACHSILLPNRHAIETDFILPWKNKFPVIASWTVHYIEGQIQIDLICNANFKEWSALEQYIQTELAQQSIKINVHLLSKKGKIENSIEQNHF